MNLVNFSSGDKVMYKDMIGVIDSVEYEHIKIKLEDNLYIVVNIEDVELIE
jgi:preprotein translocase subunit YajC|tara:strand:- start:2162 stop:2314 length:153 start_codon:yes stop_codon:yes gene_type:complete